MSFIIFGDAFTFPDGKAATNRALTYAKGFTENGIQAHVICFRNEFLKQPDGKVSGVYYYHPYAREKRSRSFLLRRWFTIRKYVRAFILVRRINRDDKVIAVHIYSYRFLTHMAAYISAKSTGARVLIERSEHPLKDIRSKFHLATTGKLKIYLETILSDGVLCISDYLINFYRNLGFRNKKILLVPSTVDTHRFNINPPSPVSYDYICYCGSLTLEKDGVNILIESFWRIASHYQALKLLLIGKGDTVEEEEAVKDLVRKLGAENRVVFTGLMSRTEVPEYLCNARILALARPNSKIADAGFPSKLTEYLSTGRPVVVTKVGEIPVYLKDNETAFLCEPDSVDAFAERLDYVLKNYEHALAIGIKGRELTSTVFNYSYQTRRISEFISSLR